MVRHSSHLSPTISWSTGLQRAMAFNKSHYLGKAGLIIGSPSLKKRSSAQSWVSTSDSNVSHCPYGLPGV